MYHALTTTGLKTTVLPVETLTQAILANTTSVFEKRLQATAFIIELQWLTTPDTDGRLTKATYYRTPKAICSPEIRTALQQMNNVYARVAYDHGNRTSKYYTDPVTTPELTEQQRKIITTIQETTQKLTKESLMSYCTDIPHVNAAETGDQLNMYHAAEYYSW